MRKKLVEQLRSDASVKQHDEVAQGHHASKKYDACPALKPYRPLAVIYSQSCFG